MSTNQQSSDVSRISFRVEMTANEIETKNGSEKLLISPFVIITTTGTLCIIIIAAIICFYVQNKNYLEKKCLSVNISNLKY